MEPQEENTAKQELNLVSDIPLKIDEVFSYAFDQSKGFKGLIWLSVLFIVLAYIPIIGIQVALEYLVNGSFDPNPEPDAKSIAVSVFNQLFITFATTPLSVGFAMLAVKRLRGEEVSATEVFNYFGKILPLFVTVLIMYVLMIIGFTLFILPGIYLAIAYLFATYFVVDKGMGPWAALESSRKLVTKHWFTVFLCMLGVGVFNIIATLPLGIGLIWSVPWSALVYGVLYLKLTEESEGITGMSA